MERKITDIVVDINDFLIIANMKNGAMHMGSNGGINLIIKSAVYMKQDEKYLLKKFFKSIEKVDSNSNLDKEFYYHGAKLPDILIDHLLDEDEDEVILDKIKKHLYNNSSWMERNGLMAIAEMSFNTDMSCNYRLYNKENIRIISKLIEYGYKVHLLGNCSRRSLDKILKSHGDLKISSITTSSDIKSVKCSSGKNYDIFYKYINMKNFIPENTLFIETHPGYIDAINKYSKEHSLKINTILYRGKHEKKYFLKDLSDILNINIDYDEIKVK